MDTKKEEDTSSHWDINSVFDFIKNNIIQILLFILVFVIIYFVDYIQNINAMIYAMPSPIPGLNNNNNNNNNDNNKKPIIKNNKTGSKNIKKNKNSKK